MDDEAQKAEPKIGLAIGLFIGIILVIADVIDLIPGAGDIVDIVIGMPLQLFLFFMGVRGVFVLISNFMELIPLLQELPTRSISWVATIIVDRNPKLEQAAQLAARFSGEGAEEGLTEAAEAGETAQGISETAQMAEQAEAATEATEAASQVEAGVAEGELGETTQGGSEGEQLSPEERQEKIEKQEKLNEALGEEESPAEKLKKQLLESSPANGSSEDEEDNEEDKEAWDRESPRKENNGESEDESAVPQSNVLMMPKPGETSSGGVKTGVRKGDRRLQDIFEQSEKMQEHWKQERGGDGAEDEDMPKAA